MGLGETSMKTGTSQLKAVMRGAKRRANGSTGLLTELGMVRNVRFGSKPAVGLAHQTRLSVRFFPNSVRAPYATAKLSF